MKPNASFQVIGTVREVRITERGQRRFRVAEILLELDTDEALLVEATHERVGAAQRLEPGDVVVITGYLRSRQGGDRWFTSASALCIAVATGSQVGKPTGGRAGGGAVPAPPPAQPEMPLPDGGEDDDVPF